MEFLSKMDVPRHKFSKHSQVEFLEFCKVAAQMKDNSKFWETTVPEQKDLEKSTRVSRDEIIEIEDDDDRNNVQEKCNDLDLPEKLNQSKFCETEDFLVALKEFLETEDILSEDVIKQLSYICANSHLQDLLLEFTNNINSQCTNKLWKSITATTCVEQKQCLIFFIDCILIKKIFTIDDKVIREMLTEVFKTHPTEVVNSILKTVLKPHSNDDLKVLNKNLNALPHNYKNQLLSQFKSKCLKLEPHHLEMLTALMSSHVNMEILTKLLELMYFVANDHSHDKSFGKLLLDIIQILGANVIQNEQQISYLIDSNKTVFMVQAKMLLENHLQNMPLS